MWPNHRALYEELFITVYLCLMFFLCEDKAHFWGLKSENYDWQVYEGKSDRNWRIPEELSALFILVCFACYWLCLQGLSNTQQQIFWGFLLRSEGLQLQMPLSSDPVSTADQNCPALLFWCCNVAWHVQILCNSGAVVLSLQWKQILLGGTNLNLALH